MQLATCNFAMHGIRNQTFSQTEIFIRTTKFKVHFFYKNYQLLMYTFFIRTTIFSTHCKGSPVTTPTVPPTIPPAIPPDTPQQLLPLLY